MTRIGLTIATAWLVAVQVSADTITLRDQAFVQGPSVRLGDIAEIRGENAAALADIELIQAASPGSVKRLSAGLVESRLSAEGFSGDEIAVEGARSIAATTMHLDVTRGMLAEDLRDHIARSMPWATDAAMIDVAPPARSTMLVMYDDTDVAVFQTPGWFAAAP